MTKLGWSVALAMLAGCPQGPITTLTTKSGPSTETGPGTDTTPTTGTQGGGGWCSVQAIFDAQCVVCHNPTLNQGNLDLQTDPYGATVGVTSSDFGVVIVAPGDPAGSLLYRKVAGTQAAGEGTEMPPGSLLPTASVAAIEQWIVDGATTSCDGTTTIPTTGTGAYHPAGWADPDQHGLTTKLQNGTDTNGTDCRSCHGTELDGGTVGVSCDTCHQSGWRDNCTYCHGGTDNTTGAPPADIDGSTTNITFPEHTTHVSGPDHPAYDCVQCHQKPVDVLSIGHIWDEASPTAGQAELDFSAGISDQGTIGGANTCSNLWCHGDGRGDNGSVKIGDGPLSCNGGCHSTSGFGLSGAHGDHLGGEVGAECSTCHPDVSDSLDITVDDQHVDGTVDVALPSGMTWSGSTCTGTCHGEYHGNRHW